VCVSLPPDKDRSYDIDIGRGLLAQTPGEIAAKGFGEAYAVVCDANTARLFGQDFVRELRGAGMHADMAVFPAGEASKSLREFERLLFAFRDMKLNRKGCVIALGGGVVGDLAGFAAGSYMRGIPFVQVPTTLLAQVDSSVGGKVAVNLGRDKNYCGLFYQPQKVVIDVSALSSLPEREFLSGLAEVVKYGVIADEDFFRFFEENVDKILARDVGVLERIVARSCEIKAGIVSQDEREAGARMILNYGHTFGHALESLLDFRETHGECVAWGMRMAARTAVFLGVMDSAEAVRQEALLDQLHLGLIPHPPEAARIIEAMKADKKTSAKGAVLILPERVGAVREVRDGAEKAVQRALDSRKEA